MQLFSSSNKIRPSAGPRAGCRGAPAVAQRALQCRALPSNETSTSVASSTLGLILGRGESGSWDSDVVGNPVVRCYIGDNEERWYMWYSGATSSSDSSGGSEDGGDGSSGAAAAPAPPPGLSGVAPGAGGVGVAVSTDGVTWKRGAGTVQGSRGAARAADVGLCLAPAGTEYWWTLDTAHVAVSDVQVFSNSSVSSGVGVYWMFYTGGDFAPLDAPKGLPGAPEGSPLEGLRMRPGLAMSQDGRNWARIEGEHHTGALFDAGAPGEWDELFVGHPCVVAAGPRDMRMFYHSWDAKKGRFAVGLATSPDGFKWTKRGPVFDGGREAGAHDELGAAACQVVIDPDRRRFLMLYEAVAADGTRSIGVATSPDGKTNWRRMPAPLLAPSDDPAAWDAGGVGAPCAVPMAGGRWRLYYAGRPRGASGERGPGPWEGIGMALSQAGGGDPMELPFKRRTGAAGPGAAI